MGSIADLGSRTAAAALAPVDDLLDASVGLAVGLERRAVDGIVDVAFDSGLLDRFLARLLASPSLWRAVEEIAASPAVRAAISQQGFGFADEVGEEVRDRSQQADDWLERAARRLAHRPVRPAPVQPSPIAG